MRTILMLAALLALPVCAWSAEDKPEPPTLTVSGAAQLQLTPDVAFITLGVETANKSLEEAQQQNASAMQKVMERLRQSGVEKERIQTRSFNVDPEYKRQPERLSSETAAPAPQIIGYRVRNMIQVEVRDLENVPKAIDGAFAAGANSFHGVRWELRDEHEARLRALKLAAGAAREKAQALSGALEVKLGRLLAARDRIDDAVAPRRHVVARSISLGSGAPVSPGEITIEANATLTYEIKKD
jgi:hypothetical protein